MSASLSRLLSFYGELKAPLLLHAIIKREFPGTVALFSPPGSDPAPLLTMAAAIELATPVFFAPESETQIRALCRQAGLQRLFPLAGDGHDALAQTIETMGILALVTARAETGLARIALDENGVFHVHPFARSAADSAPATPDWSL